MLSKFHFWRKSPRGNRSTPCAKVIRSKHECESLTNNSRDSEPLPLSNLCQYCRRICKKWSGGDLRTPHWGTYLEVVKSADDGCALCIQFLLGLSDTVRHDLETRSAENIIACSVLVFPACIELACILMSFSSIAKPTEDEPTAVVDLIPCIYDGKHHY